MTFSADSYSALADVSAAFAPPPARQLSDSELLEAQRVLAEIRRRVDAAAAALAGELHHRSRPELGYDGLAQRLGARTPEKLVQTLTGVSAREAVALVRVGTIMAPVDAAADAPDDPTAWLRAVAAAVTAGRLSIGAAEAIRTGLGTPDGVTVEALDTAAGTLLNEAPTLSVERLAARARELRAELDLARVLEGEHALREKRYLHLIPQADGMTRLVGLLDPESAALVSSAVDAATSPRRGGPRFVDREDIARAEELTNDPRTTEQIALDSLVELVRLGGSVDGSTILGGNRPAVRVLVTENDLRARRGFGFIEGQVETISIESVERHICEDGTVPILFEGGQVIDLGREVRRFTRAQRIALAARDGGCLFPECDRPPSWCEAHHIDEWMRHQGRTDIADGILLCRHHHMLVHNNGWRVTRNEPSRSQAAYAFVPPASHDPEQRPIPAPSKSRAARRLATAGRWAAG